MKKILLFLSLIVMSGCVNAQNSKIGHIPAYHILTTDSVMATPANLKKNMPVMIIYFSPDCGHCQKMMYELKPKMSQLKHIQVVMVTWSKDYDIRGIREFSRDFGLKNYHNFTVGTEGYTMFVQKYFDVKTTPFIAVYDKNGHLSQTLTKAPKTTDILKAVKKV